MKISHIIAIFLVSPYDLLLSHKGIQGFISVLSF